MITDSKILKDIVIDKNGASIGVCSPVYIKDFIFDDGIARDDYGYQINLFSSQWVGIFRQGTIAILFDRIMSVGLYDALCKSDFLEYVEYLLSQKIPYNSPPVITDFPNPMLDYVESVFGKGMNIKRPDRLRVTFHISVVSLDKLINSIGK